MPKNKIFKVAVEGNIGSGKSTFLNYFEKFPFIEVYHEPVEKWTNLRGHNFLSLLYEDMKQYSATFQSYVQLTRIQLQGNAPGKNTTTQIFERSVQSNRYCFVENGYQNGFIHPIQYNVLVEWYEWLEDNIDISLDIIVYLKTDPYVVAKRVSSRNREEEKAVSMEYINSLHKSYEAWLNNPNILIPVYTLNANQPFEEVIKSCKQMLPGLFTKPNKSGSLEEPKSK